MGRAHNNACVCIFSPCINYAHAHRIDLSVVLRDGACVRNMFDLKLVVERPRGRDESGVGVDDKLVDGGRRPPAERELVERRQFAVCRRHHAYLDARRLVFLDVEYVHRQFEARPLVVHVDYIDCQRSLAYISMRAARPLMRRLHTYNYNSTSI